MVQKRRKCWKLDSDVIFFLWSHVFHLFVEMLLWEKKQKNSKVDQFWKVLNLVGIGLNEDNFDWLRWRCPKGITNLKRHNRSQKGWSTLERDDQSQKGRPIPKGMIDPERDDWSSKGMTNPERYDRPRKGLSIPKGMIDPRKGWLTPKGMINPKRDD